MSSETENAVIRYTTDGNEPTEFSPVYTEPLELAPGVTVKARAYEDVYHEPSDAESVELPAEATENIPIGTMLNDSMIIYDRGSSYGDYVLTGSNLIRVSDGTDDLTYGSTNWRFIMADINRVFYTGLSYSGEVTIGQSNIGYGPDNTNKIDRGINTYANEIYEIIKNEADKHWFIGSIDEVSILHDIYSLLPSDFHKQITRTPEFISSTQQSLLNFYDVNISTGEKGVNGSNYEYIVLFRRI